MERVADLPAKTLVDAAAESVLLALGSRGLGSLQGFLRAVPRRGGRGRLKYGRPGPPAGPATRSVRGNARTDLRSQGGEVIARRLSGAAPKPVYARVAPR
ncbi:hypothetical protein GCM10010357_40960 [Streptomyces luteireticuli]|uniref:50S ribosomal protein L4 n=2 Tax=Streptomyces luteireticuli TaxID=173858 RepID=A0ABP3IQC5_9ACTN